MIVALRFNVTALAIFLCVPLSSFAQSRPPTIVLSGGNRMGLEISRPVRDMAGGAKAVVVVVTHERGPAEEALADWKAAEPAEVIDIPLSDIERSRATFERANIIWFAGGFSGRLMDGLRDTFLPRYVRERWAQGVIVGGDSAGAMIFPTLMLISGPTDLTSIIAGAIQTSTGLGILPKVLFDPHFVKRQRLNRLVSLVLDHPDLLGIGADEKTAIVITGHDFEVFGAANVVVLDARKGTVPRQQNGRASNGRNLRMHVLTHGMTFDLDDAAPRP
jgi:cyanophycinase